ncbi:MAG: FAD-dependent oxidoreductase [Planctomycetota bacterium]|nr:MAG: FAD-dependent oxidoreductase [Planctomycetota bacterium]
MNDILATSARAPVLVLGAGINGICVARDLVLNRVPVTIVDTRDIAFGATAKSSRLIHGGLRYLEYGDFALVRESLHERDRLLEYASDFVTPLKLHIPIRHRTGGLLAAAFRFLGWQDTWLARACHFRPGRGLWTVRLGLWFYDLLARSRVMPRHTVYRIGSGSGPAFTPDRFPWSCAYFDAQLLSPERFCVALLRDTEQLARTAGVPFEVRTYHQVRRMGPTVEVTSSLSPSGEALCWQPPVIINATGAWGDGTLRELNVTTPRLLRGTKGSHLFTAHAELRAALAGDAVYAEAPDGRLVFLIPLADSVMIGTTDERFEGSPEDAVATTAEIDYLIELTHEIFPQVDLKPSDLFAHCAGIRPLPAVDATRTAAIPRGHSLDARIVDGQLILSLIGGKLTTCRAFGEEVADRVLAHLNMPRQASTRTRPIGTGPQTQRIPLNQQISQLADRTGHSRETCQAIWSLWHRDAEEWLTTYPPTSARITGTSLPPDFVAAVIEQEWVHTLEDLTERRLMLALTPQLRRATLMELAEILHARRTLPNSVGESVVRCIARLQHAYGRTLD